MKVQWINIKDNIQTFSPSLSCNYFTDNATLKWDPAYYQNHSQVQYTLGQMAIERLDPQDGERILEIGCGNGLLTIELARKVPNCEVVSVEIFQAMCAQARANFEAEGIANVTLLNIDALIITFNNEFDAFYCNSAIHWIKDQAGIYARVHRALKTGGRNMVQTGQKSTHVVELVMTHLISQPKFQQFLRSNLDPVRFLPSTRRKKSWTGRASLPSTSNPSYIAWNLLRKRISSDSGRPRPSCRS